MIDEQEQIRREQERRWRESLELLGLDPGAKSAPAPASSPPAAEEIAESPPLPIEIAEVPEEPMDSRRFRRPFRDEESDRPAHAAPVADSPQNDIGEQEPASAQEETRGTEGRPPEPDADEEEPRRGRRKRRRGGQGTKSASDMAGDANAEAPQQSDAPPPGAEEEERGDRRRRGRSRKKKGRGKEDSPDNGEPLETPATEDVDDARPADDDAIDKDDDLSDWNVPSWNDLIAALYRPER